MRTHRARLARTLRRRTTWSVALFAALLNALTPVFAYAIGQPLHELAGGMSSAGVRAAVVQASPAIVHASTHAHAGHAGHAAAQDGVAASSHAGHIAAADAAARAMHAAPSSAPATPHCPYCLDFAAGAPLGSAVAVVPLAQPGHAPLPVAVTQTPAAARPSLRLAAPRGPPRTA